MVGCKRTLQIGSVASLQKFYGHIVSKPLLSDIDPVQTHVKVSKLCTTHVFDLSTGVATIRSLSLCVCWL
jgi:hypothetical protein